jgi:predicted transcriptional regulator of viral defense system
MNFQTAHSQLASLIVFSLSDLRLLEPDFRRANLTVWKSRGWVRMVAPGFYVFADQVLDEGVLFQIANRVYPPSYVSLESALAYYHLIPETVYAITSVGTRKTRYLSSDLGEFHYRTIQSTYYFGYQPIETREGHRFLMAEPEKAILDFLYLHRQLALPADFLSLRLDPEMSEKLNRGKLRQWADRCQHQNFLRRVETLIRYLDHA